MLALDLLPLFQAAASPPAAPIAPILLLGEAVLELLAVGEVSLELLAAGEATVELLATATVTLTELPS